MMNMETPVEIDLQGLQGRPDIRDSIEKHVAESMPRSS
jgi:hypothetical protein